MKKLLSVLLSGVMALSASALTMQDLTGFYEILNPYGSLTYIANTSTITFGLEDGDTELNKEYLSGITVTTDGDYLYFNNFFGTSFYAEVDFDAMTVTVPVQSVTAPTGYSFTLCKYDSRMFAGEGETKPSFTDDDEEPFVMYITEDGDITLWDAENAKWNYLAMWGWGANYAYLCGQFHKTGDFVPDAAVEPILGTHTCTEFKGEWCSIWGTWDNNWYAFDIATGEGIDRIGVDEGEFDVTINTLGGAEVEVNGLWWGGLSIQGSYDGDTKTITFPLQTVWGGYTLCNSSICDVEVPTAEDVVPATAVVNEDGSITFNYTVSYYNYPYLDATQTLAGNPAKKELTMQDLTGFYEILNPYGSLTYIANTSTITFGRVDGDTELNKEYLSGITVTTDGDYLYFNNFFGTSFYAEVDFDAMTVTVPVQSVTAPTGYSFTLCKYDSRMFAGEGETKPSFTDDDEEPFVMYITEDGDITLWDAENAKWNYLAMWGWGANYAYLCGQFHKTGDFVPDAAVEPILGTHTCTEFKGEWCSIWGTWDNNWYTFDIATGEGIDRIGVDEGEFDVTINTLGGAEVEVNGLWWGGLSIQGSYDGDTKTITFPLQTVWGGYILCNSSLCDVEVPTDADVVPATAVVNEDGSITFNYTVSYYNYPYLDATQTLDGKADGVRGVNVDNSDAPVEYYNIQGMRVNPDQPGIYIVRQGKNVSKQFIK